MNNSTNSSEVSGSGSGSGSGWEDDGFYFEPLSQNYITVISVVFVIIIIAAILGNLLVLLAFCASAGLRTPANYFLLSLAVSDLISACLVMPLDLDVFMKYGIWEHGLLLCEIWTHLYLILTPASIINLCAVALDRFLCISRPLRYQILMTTNKAMLCITGIWLYSIFTALIPQMGWAPYESSLQDGFCYFNIDINYNAMISIMNFIVPAIVMTVVYINIYIIARGHARRIGAMEMSLSVSAEEGAEQRRTQGRFFKRNVKASKTLLVIILTFYICWVPYTLLSIVVALCHECYYAVPDGVYKPLLILGYLNSALNPVLYAFHDRTFRDSYKKIIFSTFG